MERYVVIDSAWTESFFLNKIPSIKHRHLFRGNNTTRPQGCHPPSQLGSEEPGGAADGYTYNYVRSVCKLIGCLIKPRNLRSIIFYEQAEQ